MMSIKIKNKQIKRLRISIYLIIFILIFISKSSSAVDPPPDAFYRQSKDSPAISDIENIAPQNSFAVSLFTGAASYSYPIEVPKGTNDLQPLLTISYNHESTQKPGIIGTAWSLTESYIQRDISYSRNDTSDDKFKLVLNGQL